MELKKTGCSSRTTIAYFRNLCIRYLNMCGMAYGRIVIYLYMA